MPTKSITVTQRDKALLIALPALAVFIGYTLVFAKAPLQQLRVLATQVDETRLKVPTPAEIRDTEARVTALQREIQQAEAGILEVRGTLARITIAGTNNLERLAGGEELSALWKRHGLVLMDQRQGEEPTAVLPLPLQDLVQRAQKFRASRLARLWDVRLHGTFPQLHAALEELSSTDIPALVVSLDMSDSGNPNPAIKSWTLRIWQ